jgi:hypothetical protein
MHGRASLENAISYIHGRIEKEIEGFAQTLGIPTEILATRLAELLHPSGQRSEDTMSLVRLSPQQRQSPATRKMEMDGDARDGLRETSSYKRRKNGGITAKGKRRLSMLMKKRWRDARRKGSPGKLTTMKSEKELKKAA